MSKRRRPRRVFGTPKPLGSPKPRPGPKELRGELVAFRARCPTCGDREPKDFLAKSARMSSSAVEAAGIVSSLVRGKDERRRATDAAASVEAVRRP